MTKRIKKDLNNNAIIMISDNSKYETVSYSLNNIVEVLIVRGKITSALNVVDMDSNKKLQSLENKVQILQDDISQIKKKLLE